MTEIEFDDDELFYADDDYFYNVRNGCWEPRPQWMHPDCASTILASGQGTCCKYPADALVGRALELADAVAGALTAFDAGSGDCAQTAGELIRLIDSVPELVADIRWAVRTADRTVAAQLLCPVGRLILLVLELAGRSGCPIGCTDYGTPDRRAGFAPLLPVLEECDEVLWATVLPRPRRTKRPQRLPAARRPRRGRP